MKKLILASSSPRRKQLLQMLGLSFEVIPSNIDEKLDPKLSPRQQVENLSLQKAQTIETQFKNKNVLIIAADTMVVLKGEVIGKPKDEKDAIKILQKLSGTKHSIVTGFTLLDTETKKYVTNSTETKIWFRKISSVEIEAYIKREQPFDKAGGYAIHELASVFIEKIEGDDSGATGLSVFLLTKELKKFGINIL